MRGASDQRLAVPNSILIFLAAAIALFVAIRAGAVHLRMRHTACLATSDLAAGNTYAIDCAATGADFDLEFPAGARYALIVGSLGDPGRSYEVRLESEPADRPRRLHGRPVEPLPSTMAAAPHGGNACRQIGLAKETGVPSAAGIERAGGPNGAEPGRPIRRMPASREFFIHVTDGALDDPKQYARVTARLLTEGRNVSVYLDSQQSARDLCPGLAEEIVRLYGDVIIPAFRGSLGEHRDVDGDGRICILLSPWLSRLQGGRTSLGGFTRGADFRVEVGAPFGNQCDMIYLNTQVQRGPRLEALLAHEYAHAVCFSKRLPSQRHAKGLPDEEDWLNEAIAHVSERAATSSWTNLDYRVSRFLSSPQDYPLVVPDYYRAGLWREHGCRGATYLFLRWFLDAYGDENLGRLVCSPRSGKRNFESAGGIAFEELFRLWTIAVLMSGREAPLESDRAESHSAAFHAAGAAPPVSSFLTLDLRGRAGKYGLAGPRPVVWDVDGAPCVSRVKGTAALFVELDAPPGGGARRIRIVSERGTDLQATLVCLPDAPHRLDVCGRWIEGDLTHGSGRGGPSPLLGVWVRTAGGAAVEIECVSCEQSEGETRRCDFFGHAALEAHFRGAPNGPPPNADSQCPSCYNLPLSSVVPAESGAIVKVVARDANGRRTTGWADIGRFSPATETIRFAAAGRKTASPR
jgi:hypothetical protein